MNGNWEGNQTTNATHLVQSSGKQPLDSQLSQQDHVHLVVTKSTQPPTLTGMESTYWYSC